MDAPVRDKSKLGTLTTLIVGGVAVLSYILRVVARLPFFGGNWGYDDWVMTVAIVSITAITLTCCCVSKLTLHSQILVIPLTICAYLRKPHRSQRLPFCLKKSS